MSSALLRKWKKSSKSLIYPRFSRNFPTNNPPCKVSRQSVNAPDSQFDSCIFIVELDRAGWLFQTVGSAPMRHRPTDCRLQAADEGVKQLDDKLVIWRTSNMEIQQPKDSRYVKSSDTWYLRCRPCGAVRTTLAPWGTFRNRPLRNTPRIKRVADAKDVQISFVSQRSPARVAAGTTVRSLPSV